MTDVNVPGTNTDTGIYTINALGSGTQTATKLVNLSGAANSPTDIAIDTTNNLLFYTNGFPGLTNVEEVGVANLTTGAIINGDLVSYSASGNVEPFGIAVDPATDTLYWTTVNFSADSGNAIYSATYSTGGSVTLSDTQTLATTSQSQVPVGIALDVPSGGYYIDTSTGVPNDTTPNEIVFGGSLTGPASLTDVYDVPDQDGGTETLETDGIVVEVQPVVDASGTVTFVLGGSAIEIDSGATVSDADGYYLASATVSIASGFATGDTLNFTNQNGITGSFSSGTLTLTGAASAADYQAALDGVTFSTTSTSTTARTIDWTVSDGVASSATATSTVDVLLPPTIISVTSVSPSSEVYGQDAQVAIIAVLSWTGNGPEPTAGDVSIGGNGPSGYSATSCGAPSSDTLTCTATYTPTALDTVGSYTESASFSGDSNYSGSSSTQVNNFSITQATSATSVASSQNPSAVGQSVTFTATIDGQYGEVKGRSGALPSGGLTLIKRGLNPRGLTQKGQAHPLTIGGITGTVTWSANTGCSPSTVSGDPGTAQCTTTTLAQGTDTITATYSGDGNHSGSTGTPVERRRKKTISKRNPPSIDTPIVLRQRLLL